MTISLSYPAAFILQSLLRAPGAVNTVDEIFRAGQLLTSYPLTQAPENLSPGEMNKWLEEQPGVEMEISPAHRDMCKVAIRAGIERKQLPASSFLCELMTAFELAPV